jgi:hypothetical protein
VNSSAQFLNPSEAARRLGVSAKALRLYEARGLIAPVRTAAFGQGTPRPRSGATRPDVRTLAATAGYLPSATDVRDGSVAPFCPATRLFRSAPMN